MLIQALVTCVLSLSEAGAGPAPLTADHGLGHGLGPNRTPQEGGAVPALEAPLLCKLWFGAVFHLGCLNRAAGTLPRYQGIISSISTKSIKDDGEQI